MTTLKPLGERILVEVIPPETTTKSGLIIPNQAQEKTGMGRIVDVGDEVGNKNLLAGETVIYDKFAGISIGLEGTNYLVLEVKDILATIAK